jgi:cell division protein FtsI (penicillin-binding protein 3)
VTHDTPLLPQPDLAKQHAEPRMDEDAPSENTGDLDALFAEVNNLPADDPLRSQSSGQQAVPSAANELASVAPPVAEKATPPPAVHPAEVRQQAAEPPLQASAPISEPHPPGHLSGNGVVVNAGARVGVPSFVGEPLRVAVESATSAGLALQIVGSGIAREQVPAPGSMVAPGTEIVVRFTR